MSAGLCADMHDRVEGRAMSQRALGAVCCEEAGSEVATQGELTATRDGVLGSSNCGRGTTGPRYSAGERGQAVVGGRQPLQTSISQFYLAVKRPSSEDQKRTGQRKGS